MITVYGFEKWDGTQMVRAKYKMSAKGLAFDSGLVRIEDTAEEVPVESLNGSYIYDPNG